MSDEKHFAVCIRNPGYEGELELRKLYEVIEDPAATDLNQIRVIDESGEDYLYPIGWFVRVALPAQVEAELINLVAKN